MKGEFTLKSMFHHFWMKIYLTRCHQSRENFMKLFLTGKLI